MPTTIAGVSVPWGQEKKSETGSQTGTSGSTDTQTTTSEPSTTASSGTATEQGTTTESEPSASPSTTTGSTSASSQSSYAYSGAVNQVSPMPSSLRELLAQDNAVTVTPVGKLAEALRLANEQLDLLDPLAPELLQRTAAEIMAQASAAMVAQATHSEQSVMAVLKDG